MRQKTPIKLINNTQKTHNTLKDAADLMYQQKESFKSAGFTESQAMELVVATWLSQIKGGN
ncbi:hypothetical protein [Bacillus mycoides]|uniref:hypothetical protein n=1 Tax=Bacillus mycoides TaxID=1405 RepID=UPI00027C1969|nr:hypothetical protein [Bacillus mycoides]EJV59357.1 hypothetical protein IEU_05622 [Bacillus mycoides]